MRNVTVNSIGEYIREQREQAKISMRQLAQTAGVSNPYLSQIERGLRKPSADILQQIAKGLRISAEALYVQAGILEDRPADSGVRSALLTDPELSERQKQVLIEIYESFRRENIAASESTQAEAAALVAGESGLVAPDLTAPDLTASDLAGPDLAGPDVNGGPDLDDGAPGAEAFLAQTAMETAEMTAGLAPETEAQAAAVPVVDASVPAVAVPAVLVSDVPVSDVLVSDVPVSDVPVSDVPVSDVPVSDVPVSDVPAPAVPASVAYTPESEATDAESGSEPGDAHDQPVASSETAPPVRPDSASD